MTRHAPPLNRLPHARKGVVSFLWEGREVTAREGDSVAAALYAAGHRTLSRSRKFHRARGLSGSFVAGHVAIVDGMPHCRLDHMAVRPGMDVRAQNVWPSLGFDLLAMAQRLPRHWLHAGFEQSRLIPDFSLFWRPWERMLGFLAGQVPAPVSAGTGPVPGRRIEARTVIIGGGPAGRRVAGESMGPIVMISRGDPPGAFASSMGVTFPPLLGGATILAGYDAFALYDGGRVVAAAPHDPRGPAVLIDAEEVVLATGARSVPPLVPGADLPGVLDAHTALSLAHEYAVPPGARVVVVGTGERGAVAERLKALGVSIAAVVDVHSVQRIEGRDAVTSVFASGRWGCDAVVHAGPWRRDVSLAFQAAASGELRLEAAELPGNLRPAGAMAQSPEPVCTGTSLDSSALVCPCMDVTVEEVLAIARKGEPHVEEIKRLTGCGMGPCQGVPCWDLLAAVLAVTTGREAADFGHPSYRPPRAALTLAQAAGLADLKPRR